MILAAFAWASLQDNVRYITNRYASKASWEAPHTIKNHEWLLPLCPQPDAIAHFYGDDHYWANADFAEVYNKIKADPTCGNMILHLPAEYWAEGAAALREIIKQATR